MFEKFSSKIAKLLLKYHFLMIEHHLNLSFSLEANFIQILYKRLSKKYMSLRKVRWITNF